MIRYIGNKKKLSGWILETCPKEPTNWVEPFGGMFGVFFNLDLTHFPNTRFIYNEINPHHLNLFKYLKDPSFIKVLKNEILDEREYLKSFDNYQNTGSIGSIAWLKILCGSRDIRNILTPNYSNNTSWLYLINSLDSKTEYFDRMEIENLNYDQCIKKWDSERTFFYLDPPYFGYEDYYTHHNFNKDDHKKLRDIIYTINGEWTLSYYNFTEMENWYNKYYIDKRKYNLGMEYLIKKSE